MLNQSLSTLDSKEALKGIYGTGREGQGIIGSIIQALHFAVSIGSIPARLILRRNLGERSFSVFTFIICIALHFWYTSIFWLFFLMSMIKIQSLIGLLFFIFCNPFLIYILIICRLGIKHFKEVVNKARNNQTGYSFYRGDSRYFSHCRGRKWRGFAVGDTIIRMIIEPKTFMKYGLIMMVAPFIVLPSFYQTLSAVEAGALITGDVSIISISTSAWTFITGFLILLSGFFLLCDEGGIFLRIRNAVLDMTDSEYDMQYLLGRKAEINRETSDKKGNLMHDAAQVDGYAFMPEDEWQEPEEMPVSPPPSVPVQPVSLMAKMTINEKYRQILAAQKNGLAADTEAQNAISNVEGNARGDQID